ncbi:MAG: PAS domain S-box protein [Deltaproteobacteria bacterium]|nr:PAS domain S-box protein [Deltaproteobacteria bacterium]
MKSEPDYKMTSKNDEAILSRDILIVDDEVSNLILLTQLLALEGYQARPAERPQLAIDSALAKPPALILLDVRMPEMDGFEVCKCLKQDERTRDIPIIFISALQDMQDKVRGFEVGGVDFITKPFQEREVLARVRTHMDLRNMQMNLERMVAKRTAEVIESEQLFRTTFEQAAVGIAHVSPEGRFLRVNRKFCDIVGYSEDEILALTFQDITHPDDLEADLDYVRQVLNGEIETYSIEKRYYHKDGSIVWINLTVSLLFDREGNPKYFVSVIRDISDRKQAEEALQQSRDFLEHLISAVPDAIFSVKMPERTINWANDSFNVLGYESEEYIGQSTRKYYANPEYYDAIGRLQQDAIRKGDNIVRTEIMVLCKDGRVIPAEFTATYYREEGELSQITAFVRDISERKLAEEKLVKSEEKYRSLVENSMVGVFTTTIDGRLTFANDALARMFDFASPEQIIAQGALGRWSDIRGRERMLAELQKHGSVTNFEAETITYAGRRIHVLFSAKLLGDNIFGMMMDITERKKAEQKIIDYQQRLKALAFKLTIAEEKERRAIAANLHDHVMQALALIRIQLASACKSTNDSKLADKLYDISNFLLETLEEVQMLMLELSSPAMHEIGLSSAISEWLDEQINKRYGLRTEVINNVPIKLRKTLDPDVRTILFRNVRELIVNVVKHARANEVSVRLEDRSQSIRIIVEDDGIGFDTRAATRAGSQIGGFGLFSIEELMVDLGGSLRMVSAPGKGCTAILSAPFHVDKGRERS